MSSPILLLGGTSDIGGEIALRLCPGRPVILAGRSPETMEPVAEKLRAHGAESVSIIAFDATDGDSHRRVVEQAGGAAITDAIVAFGILGDQHRAERDEQHAAEIAHIDYVAQVSMLTVLADVMRSGTIYAFSSIAGWRARRANYVYGSTKAGLDAFCQGLTDRLHGTDVHLLTARPGFVIGSMTTGMTPAPLSSAPAQVAEAVLAARGRSATVWIPARLRVLAWIMSCVPRPVWRRMPR
ncbi:putative oxidoreductase [Corynebacterium ciconiae DSM 44920]|uniref:SDR family oxidoreductase n=1 Tax=Corynebacterium ciconiae TaxID=227319 RepID=UPI00038275E1|nr:SDR family oxidoreductase [Corynebacterium ciconiae]WKD61175.1 putative oxidoreductase [Corynebacterium ciconiae DSM 44920]